MTCLSSTRRAEIIAEIATLNTQLTAINAAFLESISTSTVTEYRFDSGDGSQKTIYRSPKELNDLIDDLTSRRNRLQRLLTGGANVTLQLRRDQGNGYGRRRY